MSTAGWKTYTNSTYGFSIAYPPTMHLENAKETSTAGSYSITDPCASYDNANLSPVRLLTCFTLGQGTYPDTTYTDFLAASLAVFIPNLSQQHCIFVQDSYKPVRQVFLNGINFYLTEGGGAAAGLHGHFINYRTYAQKTCWDFDITIASEAASENGGSALGAPIIPFSEERLNRTFAQMLSRISCLPPTPTLRTATPLNTSRMHT